MILKVLSTYFLIHVPKIHTNILWDLSVLFTILIALYSLCIFSFKSLYLKKRPENIIPAKQSALRGHEPRVDQEHQKIQGKVNNFITQKLVILASILKRIHRDFISFNLMDRIVRIGYNQAYTNFWMRPEIYLKNEQPTNWGREEKKNDRLTRSFKIKPSKAKVEFSKKSKVLKVEIIDAFLFSDVEFIPKENSSLNVGKKNTALPTLECFTEQHLTKERRALASKNKKTRADVLPNESIASTLNQPLKTNNPSIFQSLFEHSDEACKLLLLEEIHAMGDRKELRFLESLTDHFNVQIRSTAILAKAKLQKRLNDDENFIKQGSRPKQLIRKNESSLIFEPSAPRAKKEDVPALDPMEIELIPNTADVLPLEFCFLLQELEIQPAKSLACDVFEIEFDLAL
tara:strand:+ start:58903 stop:60105 length:1203 start_codon:yes stop_codon:yes gene_type:complete